MPHPPDGQHPCPCCDGVRWAVPWPGFITCRSCGLMTVSADYSAGYTDQQLHAMYGESYFHGAEYADYLADKPDLQQTLAGHLRWVRRYVPPGRRILEIGCAYGYFLELIRHTYPDSLGVDISAESVSYARGSGLNALAGDLLEMDVPGLYDAVCLWDTIEHLPHPAAMIRKAATHLRPGGHLFLTTGDFGALLPRIQGRRWRQIHPPTHLFYFTRDALAALCAKLGFDVVTFATVTTHIHFRTALLTLQGLHPRSPAGRLAKAAYRLLPDSVLQWRFPLNLGDTVLLVARRVE
jgi:SAM-dependent methyltransferase